ncbi:N-benzyl-3-pyrrolidinol dehydrogenase [Epithele typhae]|uniref:N-benzyl-3-pyrrolidinol dehydrogenase n=1 Tax=Epithele typhae TaxID=378194 RepID=UPI00200826A7|nr:N-benzyl-3-pyrrolidinol dehydrogenase [Epithele typhae]KAH9939059.1 N-benzyl-3-pyrrolidinol dehydrogenase [Epithele typhae]
MRAAVYSNGDNEFVIQDVAVPTPGPSEVLLQIAAAGVCHSDTFILSDDIPDSRTYVAGHENVGYAILLGSDVVGIDIGKLYAIWAIVPHGPNPLPGLPEFTDSIGLGLNGGFAEYITVDASNLVPVPDGLAPEIAACAADSLITVYNAMHNLAQLRPGTTKRVLVYGVGGLGHQAVQLAGAYGATPAARALALRLGATQAFHPSELEARFAAQPVGAAGRFGVDVVFDFVSCAQSFALAQEAVKNVGISSVGPPGVIVIVGVSGETFTFSPATLLLFRTHVLTSLYGSKSDLAASLELLKKGTITPVVTTEQLENTDKVIEELRASKVVGRKVIVPMRNN